MDSLKRQRQIQDVNLEEALNMATDAKSVTERKAALESAKIIKNLSEIAEKLANAEKGLGSILAKKPKLK